MLWGAVLSSVAADRQHHWVTTTPARALPRAAQSPTPPGSPRRSPPSAASLASLAARTPADCQTLDLHTAARGAAGSPASSLRSWPSFSSFTVVVTSTCRNTEPPRQPVGLQTSLRLWRFPHPEPRAGTVPTLPAGCKAHRPAADGVAYSCASPGSAGFGKLTCVTTATQR